MAAKLFVRTDVEQHIFLFDICRKMCAWAFGRMANVFSFLLPWSCLSWNSLNHNFLEFIAVWCENMDAKDSRVSEIFCCAILRYINQYGERGGERERGRERDDTRIVSLGGMYSRCSLSPRTHLTKTKCWKWIYWYFRLKTFH